MKNCTKCNESKPLERYGKHPDCKDGLQSQCKECYALASREWRKSPENMERHRRNAYIHSIKKLYGISAEVYDEMLHKQNGVCAICKLPEKRKRFLSVDHSHDTGEVRGLLCAYCNTLLGQAKDDVEVLRSAIVYLGYEY